MLRNRSRIATTLAAGALVFALGACGDEQSAAQDSSTTTATSQASTQPPSSTATSDHDDAAASSSAPVVGGPRPAPRNTDDNAADDGVVEAGDQVCGTTRGPDGPLRVVVRGGDVGCDEATRLAEQYGPQIATGQPQTVDGWSCAPSQVEGVLAACTRDGNEIGFAP